VGEGDHLGLHDIQDLEKMTLVKRTIVDVVLPTGTAVLNAADPLVAGMAEHCRGSVLFFSPDGLEAVLVEHRARGGRAVFASDGWITLAEGAEETPLVALADVPLTRGGRIPFQVENALAAASGAWAAGVSLESIRQGLLSFVGGFDEIPARFNVFPFRGGTVIFDDAHNASALTALIRALDEFPQDRRSIVFSASGDRRDSDILRQGELLGKAFDRVVLYEACAAGERGEGEVAALLRQALASGDRVSEILAAGQPLTAAETALEMFRPGELLVIQSDDVDETAAFIRAWLADAAAEKSEAASSAAEVNTP
jgi:cyanophycin synthetase